MDIETSILIVTLIAMAAIVISIFTLVEVFKIKKELKKDEVDKRGKLIDSSEVVHSFSGLCTTKYITVRDLLCNILSLLDIELKDIPGRIELASTKKGSDIKNNEDEDK